MHRIHIEGSNEESRVETQEEHIAVEFPEKHADTHIPEEQISEIATRTERLRRQLEYLKGCVCHSTTLGSPCKSQEPSNSAGKSYAISNFINYDHLISKHKAFFAALMSHTEPKSYTQPVKHQDCHTTMEQKFMH